MEPKETGWHNLLFFLRGMVFVHRVIVEDIRRFGSGFSFPLRAKKTPMLGNQSYIVGVFLA